MAQDSRIEWTHHTFNIVWGCQKVSEGCKNCYADSLATRYGFKIWGPNTERRTFGEKHWKEPLAWNKAAQQAGERHRVFCSSMADVFENHPTLAVERQKLWALIDQTPHLDWLLLTKRPENMPTFAPPEWSSLWPKNVWAGTSVENQERAIERIPLLLQVPVFTRFLSCEPLLGPVDLNAIEDIGGISWVIVGGESGHGARPMKEEWASSLRRQCEIDGIAFFFKQWGEYDQSGRKVGKKIAGRVLEGLTWNQYPDSWYYFEKAMKHDPK